MRSRSAASTATTSTTCYWRCPSRSCRAACASACRERILADGSVLRTIWTRSRSSAWRRAARARGSRRSPSASCTAFATRSTSDGSRRCWPRRRPEIAVSISSDVVPEIREYERTSTTVANVYVQAAGRALPADARGAAGAARVRRRAAASCSPPAAGHRRDGRRFPVRLLETGPAAGALAAAFSAGRRVSRTSSPSTWAAPPPRPW